MNGRCSGDDAIVDARIMRIGQSKITIGGDVPKMMGTKSKTKRSRRNGTTCETHSLCFVDTSPH